MKKILMLLIVCMMLQKGYTQGDEKKPALVFSGYTDVYYTYDFNKPINSDRPGFIYSHNRHNEINLNLGFIKAAYSAEKVRANLALAAGTYMNANYSTETGVLKNVYEANAGIKIGNKKNLWLDAGIFSSHIGFESAISKDCWNPTRSILAENSPYYEAGAKLTYTTDNEKWLISLLALNGWQRIKRAEGNSLISAGTQVQYKPSDKIVLNYSSFIGTDKPDTARLLRIFHNLYGVFTINEKWGLILGFDIGMEEKTVHGNAYNTWYSPVAIMKYKLNSQWVVAARAEYYNDKNAAIITTGTNNGFRTAGYSANIDYAPSQNVLVRIEARNLTSKDDIFIKGNNIVNTNTFVTGSISVNF